MKRWFWSVGALVLVLVFASTRVCLSSGFRYGLWLDQCPDGEFRQTVEVKAPGLMRGAQTTISVGVTAHYTTGDADVLETVALTKFTPTVTLLGAGDPRPLEPKDGWKRNGNELYATVLLPKVNDGDYRLHTSVASQLGTSVVDAPLPLYSPARIHVLTDRPLYEPGNTVKFRTVVLRASDLSPLDERPGVWRVIDPNGEVLLEERASAAAWGVVSGSFPLDQSAASGSWQVSWSSGTASQTRSFTVKPFTLPRFSVEASSAKPFYRRNERPVLKGTVKYSSGAPVAKAKVSLSWSIGGQWPAPTSWVDGTALPKLAVTSEAGTFSVDLPAVPEDLQKQASLVAALSAVDASGDVVEGSASILLSEDLIQVSGVTELADGLVEGFNNRLYLRATTADGRVLEGVSLNVKRLWEPADKGTDAVVDEDGVASLQVDPGPAVNVVMPALPFRPPPKATQVTRTGLRDLLASEEISLGDRLAFDRVEQKLTPCTRFAGGGNGNSAQVGLLVDPSGAVSATSVPAGRLGKCLREALGSLRLEGGHERLVQASYSFNDEDLPSMSSSVRGLPGVPSVVQSAIDGALPEVRDCLPATVTSGELTRMASWKYLPASRELNLTWLQNPDGAKYSDAILSCVQGRLSKLKLPKSAQASTESDEEEDAANQAGAVGIVSFSINAPAKYESERPQETIVTGYQFLVSAKRGKESLGSTKLLMMPGAVPNVRLRANSQIIEPGSTITVDILRGPNFTGELPDELYLMRNSEAVKGLVDKEKRSVSFVVPKDFEGWASVSWAGARVVFFVQPKALLAVRVTPEKTRYAPGQVAQLGIETTVAGAGSQAAVGLFGVDESLAQLAALPGADELAPLRPQVGSSAPFGGLDAQALSMGRVRGRNAAAATLLRVTTLPSPPESETAVNVQGQTFFDPNESLVDRFYVVLQELHVQVGDWEAHAPENEKMSPKTMASLWKKAIASVEARKESASDAWGRQLRLFRLPTDLLALTEPRQVVIDGKRLPEDTENWSSWVAKEKP